MAQTGRSHHNRQMSSRQWHHDVLMMAAGFVLAVVFCMALFELLNLRFHWIGGADVHGSAPQSSQQSSFQIRSPLGAGAGARMIFTSEKSPANYAVPGGEDAPLLNFSLSPSSDGFIHSMMFTLDDLAHPYDLKSLKLFLGGQQLGEVSFFEGKGSFDNLMVKMEANTLMNFSVTAAVSDQAEIGDRLRLKVADQGIQAEDNDGNDFSVASDGEMSGPVISIVHGNSK